MFSALRRTFGAISVKEGPKDIVVEGVPADIINRDISRLWNTGRIESWMFTKTSKNGFSFPKFFAIEIHYMLQRLEFDKQAKSSRRTIKHLIKELEEETWLKRLSDEPTHRLDFNQLHTLNFELFKHQHSFLQYYDTEPARYDLNGALAAADPGTGKAQPLDAPIRVPGGWSTMGQMTPGTRVVAKDGSVTTVTGVYPQGEKAIYKVTFADGRSTECCAEHLWRVRWHGHGKVNQSMHVLDTATIAEQLKRVDQRIHVPLIDPEDYPAIQAPIDPYTLGVLIGDARLAEHAVVLGTPDQFILDELAKAMPDNLKFNRVNRYDYRIVSKEGRSNRYLNMCRSLGLSGKLSTQKFIPEIYFKGSVEQRLALIQGLMDTDGTVDRKTGTLTYSTSSERLATEVQRLIWSLGGIAKITSRFTHYMHKGEKRRGQRSYRIWIRYRKPSDLVRLPRKRERVKDDGQYVNNLMLKITAIEPVGVKPAQCISIAHPDRLYVTSDYIVTHNTILSLALAQCLHSDLIVIVSPKIALDRVWVDTVDKLFKERPTLWNAADGKPYAGERIILGHYEALAKVQATAVHAKHTKPTLIVDESHNFNESKSNRTQALVALRDGLNCKDVVLLSGTPLKAMGYEVASILKLLDPLFTPDVEERFVKIFGRESGRALDILRHRIGKLSYRIEKEGTISNETVSQELKIKLRNGHEYTLDAIRSDMQSYVDERKRHYDKYFKSYRKAYEEGIEAFERVMTPDQKSDLKRYRNIVAMISKRYDPQAHKEEAAFANHFEAKVILPSIPEKRIRDGFKEAKSVIKYVDLKIVGEALAHIVGRARVNVHLDMVRQIDWKAIATLSRKKVIVFSSYVEVIKAIEKQLSALGFKYAVVTGETSSNVNGIVGNFAKDEDEKFLLATYQSLSTAVPLTMADVTVFTNPTWRDGEMIQAKARTDRIGQDGAVRFIHAYLDTGSEPNISTRAKDILEWSKAQVEAMMGPSGSMNGVTKELTKDINTGAMEAYLEPGTDFTDTFEGVLEAIEAAFE